MALAAGSVAFALGPFVGRGAAAGIAGFITIAGFIVTGYSAPVPELAPIANLTWFGWTDQPPAAGRPVRLAVGRVPGDLRRGHADDRLGRLRAARHRRHEHRADAIAAARAGGPGRSDQPVDRPQPERGDRVGPGHRRLRPAPRRIVDGLHGAAAELAGLHEPAQHGLSRTSTSRRWAGSCSCCSSSSASCSSAWRP